MENVTLERERLGLLASRIFLREPPLGFFDDRLQAVQEIGCTLRMLQILT